ncbi:hypothetical protein GLOTRDRAFT_47201 [Gloeophyllum trabeum ATCC 11539]|uniref:Uncharacterized protein n=1 Tax=Gloeophyllum trabeum (strain ATCC 11539 / FP-39264 / Madison 617) TaxID=670483 RepID=S7PY34_GLOTA|nr:uncharacterized protein GLOTRDRAFT_47201 [Gloeophyllum trabeum ATCC 11539]EPQ52536.1 hypothetical protein GLOTRDRAFT_47201 [Gloeophyllum trabeum ATCC 11539]
MSTAIIDSKGTEIFFTDSGPVPGSDDYTTLVIYHGSAFTGSTFEKVVPLAGKDNIRLVTLNRRDYAGSTKYSDSELEDLNAGRIVFMVRAALEVANFLVWFAETHKIPPVSSDGKSGGLAVLGWSMGCAWAIALFGHPDKVPKRVYDRLKPYYRMLILYDPPHLAFGYELPCELKRCLPWYNPDFPTPADVAKMMPHWVSSYYDQSKFSTRDIMQYDFSSRTERASIDSMTSEQCARNCDSAALVRLEVPMLTVMQPALRKQTEKALFDEEVTREIFPNVEIVLQVCTSTLGSCLYGFSETERMYNECLEKGIGLRPIKFQYLEGNHFVSIVR